MRELDLLSLLDVLCAGCYECIRSSCRSLWLDLCNEVHWRWVPIWIMWWHWHFGLLRRAWDHLRHCVHHYGHYFQHSRDWSPEGEVSPDGLTLLQILLGAANCVNECSVFRWNCPKHPIRIYGVLSIQSFFSFKLIHPSVHGFSL